MSETVCFSDICGRGIKPKLISHEKAEAFWAGVDAEMKRLGYDEANRLTAQSEILTERDYEARVNI